ALYARFRRLAPSGYLLQQQFQQTMGVMGLTDDHFLVDRMFHVFDTDHDGKLSFIEFATALAVMIRGSEDEKLAFSFQIVAGKEEELKEPERRPPSPSARTWARAGDQWAMPLAPYVALVVALGLGVVAVMAWPGATKCDPLKFGEFQGKSDLDLDAQMTLKANALKSVKKRKLAEKIVLKAMKTTGHKFSHHFDQKQDRALPANPADAGRDMLTKDEIIAYRASKKAKRAREATNAYCAFNVLEAFVSVVGL
ncbi:ncsA, partial [Symbiodinium pilosum]